MLKNQVFILYLHIFFMLGEYMYKKKVPSKISTQSNQDFNLSKKYIILRHGMINMT